MTRLAPFAREHLKWAAIKPEKGWSIPASLLIKGGELNTAGREQHLSTEKMFLMNRDLRIWVGRGWEQARRLFMFRAEVILPSAVYLASCSPSPFPAPL